MACPLEPSLEQQSSEQFDEYQFFTELRDESGRPRLKCARHYFSELKQEDVPFLVEGFKAWKSYHEYLLIKGENRVNGKKMFLAVKCSKRGNDVFSRRLDKRLGFLKRLKGIEIFHPNDFKPNRIVKTNLLWVTLTYNPICSLETAWLNCMDEWNLFITNLRNKYGKIDVLRFIEAFPNKSGSAYGYPHFHVVLLFQEAKFTVFPHLEERKDGKLGLVYRINEKYEVESQGNWHSYVDICALSSGRAVFNYVRKYCQKTHSGDSSGALVTQSLLWLYRKQTFSMSKGFRSRMLDLISHMQGSKTRGAQKTFDGEVLNDWIWSFHGVRSILEIGCEPACWVQSLEEEKFNKIVGDKFYS